MCKEQSVVEMCDVGEIGYTLLLAVFVRHFSFTRNRTLCKHVESNGSTRIGAVISGGGHVIWWLLRRSPWNSTREGGVNLELVTK